MSQQNIIFIVMDTARSRNFPFHGYERNTAPFLNELKEESVLYKNAYSQHIWTLPSHTSMFNSEYGKNHGGLSDSFRMEENTAVEKLRSEGFVTHSISNNKWISEDFGWDTSFDTFVDFNDDFPFENDKELWNKFSEADDQGWTSDLKMGKYIDYTLECLKQGNIRQLANGLYYLLNQRYHIGDSGARRTNKKFRDLFDKNQSNFFFMNYIEPHGPYRPQRSYRTKFTPDNVNKEELFRNEHYLAHNALNGEADMSQRQLDIQEALYDAEILYLDKRLRELYEHLESEGVLEDTYLIITSDHGEYFGEHDLYRHHGGLYPEATHVPLLVRHPDGRSEEVSEPVEMKDIGEFIKSISEEDNPDIKTRDYAFSEYYRGYTSNLEERLEVDRPECLEYQAGIQDSSHFLKITESSEEFWDKDKHEKIDQETEKRAEMRDKLQEKFGEVIEEPEKYVSSEERDVDEEVKSQLKKLGYMN